MSIPKVSVITTVYNVERYLRDSLDSLFNQSFKDYEVIIVNDGSTDGTRDIILGYLDKPNVRLLENANNEGIPVSRNRALLAAKGEYVAIHDGDDLSLPDRFEKEVQFLDSHPEITFMGGHAYQISITGALLGSMSYPPPDTLTAFKQILQWKLNPIIDPSCMFRKKSIVDIGGYTMDEELRTALDLQLWCRLLAVGHKLSNLQEPLIRYRINPDGVTRTERSTMMTATDLICATFKRRSFDKVELRPDYFSDSSFTEYKGE